MAFGHTIWEHHYDYLRSELALMRQMDENDIKAHFR
jgi:hypothetical protein